MYDQNANRRYYLERGRCPTCSGKNLLPPGQKQCPDCQARQRQRYKEKRDKWRAEGKCGRCGRETDGIHKLCEMHRKEARKYAVDGNRKKKEVRDERKAAGKCVVCGVAWAEGGHTMCMKCLAHHREKSRVSAANSDKQTKRAELRELGLCVDCRKPVKDGYRYCPVCRERHADSARKYRIHQRTIKEGLAWE